MTPARTVHKVRVGCKVNLGLRITGVRPNGYHELDSLFLPLAVPHDELEFVELELDGPDHTQKTSTSTGITVECDTPGVDPARNTLTRAHAAFARRVPGLPPVRVRLRKGIPHGAGLGGGSADAAAVLRWCNARASTPLDGAELAAAALEVGADVPFFLHNVPARVRGIGERIMPCASPWQGWTLLLLCPDVHISTPWAYAAWDAAHSEKILQAPAQHCLTSYGLEAKEECSCAAWLLNDFESVVFRAHPELGKLKENLLRMGASAAVMSGSGASMAGLFRNAETAQRAAEHLEQEVQIFTATL